MPTKITGARGFDFDLDLPFSSRRTSLIHRLATCSKLSRSTSENATMNPSAWSYDRGRNCLYSSCPAVSQSERFTVRSRYGTFTA